MNTSQLEDFYAILKTVMGLYGKNMSEMACEIWFEALKTYDFKAVRQAFGRHVKNPDTGQFFPKPADIIRMLEGTTADAAALAWAKVMQGVGSVGGWQSVCFDDPVIHLVIGDMPGGWPSVGAAENKDLPYLEDRFKKAYRAYKSLAALPPHLPHLPGHFETGNVGKGYKPEPPMLLGDPQKSARVLESGSNAPRLPACPAPAGAVKLKLVRGAA